jgi:uncharacterized protein
MNFSMRRILFAFASIFFLSFVWISSINAAPNYPVPVGFFVDQANIIDDITETRITARLSALEATSTSEIAVVTVSSLEGYSIEEYSTGLFSYWGLGKEKRDNGVLLLVAPAEREVRIEVGYGLEGALTDYESSLIIETILTPAFREGKYSEGVENAVDALAVAVEGEYSSEMTAYDNESGFVGWTMGIIMLLIFGFFVWVLSSALLMELSRSKSIVGGSVFGGLIGAFVGGLNGSWIFSAIVGAIVGAIVDWVISSLPIFKRFRQKAEEQSKRRPPGSSKGGFGGFGGGRSGGGGASGGSSGGFGGFGGGRSGGGGASGKW